MEAALRMRCITIIEMLLANGGYTVILTNALDHSAYHFDSVPVHTRWTACIYRGCISP